MHFGYRSDGKRNFPSLEMGALGLFPTWDLEYPRTCSVGFAVTYAGRFWLVGWGWAPGERVSLVPRYQMMPDPTDGKTLTWAGFYFQHSVS